MNYVNYKNYVEERRIGMRGRTDACYMNMKFESFVAI